MPIRENLRRERYQLACLPTPIQNYRLGLAFCGCPINQPNFTEVFHEHISF